MTKRRILVLSFGLCIATLMHTVVSAQQVDFDRDIRPILSNNCFACHGPDENARQAELRLDDKDSVFAGRDIALIQPGNSATSELFRRIASTDENEIMPPADFRKKLTSQQIDLIKRWIDQGAEWKQHWSWTAPNRPQVPQADQKAVANAVDNFIFQQLEQDGLSISSPADRVTLIRRLSFDLLGLPPSTEEVAAFVNDKDPNAYSSLVQRLLKKPQYGERLAMYWLDIVRYADSNGYHADKTRQIAPYRDYVINAFNSNKPYDEFVREQLGGDLMENATTEQQVASGYNMLLQTTDEGGAQAKEYLAKYSADRVRNTASIFLGVTLGCAECHDHKYDPFTTQDFYNFASFFADINEVGVGNAPAFPVINGMLADQIADKNKTVADKQNILNTLSREISETRKLWETALSKQSNTSIIASKWQYIGPISAASFNEAHDKSFVNESEVIDLNVAVGGRNWAEKDFADATIHALDQSPNAAHYLQRTLSIKAASKVELRFGSDDGIRVWVNQKEVLNNKVTRGPAADQEKVTVELTEGDNTLLVKISQGAGGAGFYYAHNSSGIPSEIMAILLKTERTEPEQNKLSDYYRDNSADLKPQRDEIVQLQQQLEELNKSAPRTLMTRVREPRMIRVLPRGNWMDDSGTEASPTVPGFMKPLTIEGRRPNRLDLANWMVDPDNPLTSRVVVNRLWKLFFGSGLAEPLDDLGAQGTRPTHPELLDWLAVELIDSGWDLKHIASLIVHSNTYRQASTLTAELAGLDPYNHKYARQSQFRLEAEMIRDTALSISGLLSDKVGGLSVKPYQPAGYWKHMNFPKRTWQMSGGNDIYRRGLYTHWQRMFLHPSLLAFDAPSREECTVSRPRSNTPQQALVLLNDPTYVEAARAFAERILAEGGGDDSSKLNWAFQTALSRNVNPNEANVLLTVLAKHLENYKTNPQTADEYLSVGRHAIAETVDKSELAAWTSVARIILNLHETITRN
ncbi:MAG: hypothetical protein CMJ76_03350 [Planctomycetaceae bacterium]|nr:hypothetical protein [Planctomycetaceae bacterium]